MSAFILTLGNIAYALHEPAGLGLPVLLEPANSMIWDTPLRRAPRSSMGLSVMSGACSETAPRRGLSMGRPNGRSRACLEDHPHLLCTWLRTARRGPGGPILPAAPIRAYAGARLEGVRSDGM